jgi:hypothetical protein
MLVFAKSIFDRLSHGTVAALAVDATAIIIANVSNGRLFTTIACTC